jgi:hypothetical protein
MSGDYIAYYRSRIYAGGVIYGDDITAIFLALQAYSGHVHYYYDLYSQYNYGNVDGGTVGDRYKLTNAAPGTNNGYSPSGTIKASDINYINAYARAFQNHAHSLTDQYGV